MSTTAMDRAHTFGALLICDHDKPIMFRATMESTGPAAVQAFLLHALDRSWIVPPGIAPISEGVLDVLAEDGDIVGDFDIPNHCCFEELRTALELRSTSTDCSVCDPTAYVATYGRGDCRG